MESLKQLWQTLDGYQKFYSLTALSSFLSLPLWLGNPNGLIALGVSVGYGGTFLGYSQALSRSERKNNPDKSLHQIAYLESVIAQKDSGIADLQAQIGRLNLDIQQLNQILGNKDCQISEQVKKEALLKQGFKQVLETELNKKNDAIEKELEAVKEREIEEIQERSRRFKAHRTKLLEKLQTALDEKKAIEGLLNEVKASQQELLELFEANIRDNEIKLYELDKLYRHTVDEKDLELQKLRLALASLPKSARFNGGDTASINGNRLIDMFNQLGMLAHAHQAQPGKAKDVIWLKSDWLLEGFEKHKDRIYQAFELVKPPTITLDRGLIKFELHHSSSERQVSDITRHCRPYHNLETLVKKWERIKIDGGSEAGKSPFADNLIALKQKEQASNIVLSNPLFGSKKDYWKIPATYKSFGEAAKGLAVFKNELHDRANKAKLNKELNYAFPDFPFNLYIFDEIDITLKEGDKETRENLKEILKTASHYNMGIIFIGQSPYCTDVGMKQADFNNCVQIHIGRTALKAIELASYSDELKAKLKNEYEMIDRHYAEANREILDEKIRYRFALVDDSKVEPYFIELPPFGYYTIADIEAESVGETADSVADLVTMSAALNQDVEAITAKSATMAEKSLCCPDCKSANIKRHSKRGNKIQLQCLNDSCLKKYFTVAVEAP